MTSSTTRRTANTVVLGVQEVSDEKIEDNIEGHTNRFSCPEEICVKYFQRFSFLQQYMHLHVGMVQVSRAKRFFDWAIMSICVKTITGLGYKRDKPANSTSFVL